MSSDSDVLHESVYLDYNIFYGLGEGTILHDDLIACIGKSEPVGFSYSEAHILEVCNIPESTSNRMDIVKKRLDMMNYLSEGLYLYQNDNNPESIKYAYVDAYEMFKIAESESYKRFIMRSASNFVGEKDRKSVRDLMATPSKELNNYSPEQAIAHIARLASLANMSIWELRDQIRSFHYNKEQMGFHNDVAGFFEILDILGFWRDDYHESSNYARLWDALHTAFAGYCHYFVTADKKTFNKAKVIYEMYQRKTTVLLFQP